MAPSELRGREDGPAWVAEGGLKDDQQLFPFLLRLAEEMGLLRREGFRLAYERISDPR